MPYVCTQGACKLCMEVGVLDRFMPRHLTGAWGELRVKASRIRIDVAVEVGEVGVFLPMP